jgi:hypothetical protein
MPQASIVDGGAWLGFLDYFMELYSSRLALCKTLRHITTMCVTISYRLTEQIYVDSRSPVVRRPRNASRVKHVGNSS